MKIALVLLVFILSVSSLAIAGEGHDAGRKWAEDKGIDDPSNCYSRTGGPISNSPSFTAGCLEHLREERIPDDEDELRENDDSSESEDEEDEE